MMKAKSTSTLRRFAPGFFTTMMASFAVSFPGVPHAVSRTPDFQTINGFSTGPVGPESRVFFGTTYGGGDRTLPITGRVEERLQSARSADGRNVVKSKGMKKRIPINVSLVSQ